MNNFIPDYIHVKHMFIPLEYDILYYRKLGLSSKQIAEEYHLSCLKVNQIYEIACEKLELLDMSKIKLKETKVTICQLITILHCTAKMEKNIGRMEVLKQVYIMAKKMNRRLMKYKHGKLPNLPGNSWNEKDWEKDLK